MLFRTLSTVHSKCRSTITTATTANDNVLVRQCSFFIRSRMIPSTGMNRGSQLGEPSPTTAATAATNTAAAIFLLAAAASYSTCRITNRGGCSLTMMMMNNKFHQHASFHTTQMWWRQQRLQSAATTTMSRKNSIRTTTHMPSQLRTNDPWTRIFGAGRNEILQNRCNMSSPFSSSSSSYFHRQQERRLIPRSVRSFTTSPSSSSSSNASTTGTSKVSFMEWYERNLSTHPILTKMVTGSILWGLGDMVAQLIPQFSTNDVSSSSSAALTYDYIRTGRAAVFGCFIHAPSSHVHYNFLEYITVQMKFTGYSIPIFKAFMEQFVYWSWISNSIYFAAMGAMQGLNLSQIYQRICDVLWETQVAQWTFWIPIQLINFQYTPVRHQLNVVLITSIVWTALLSMWYPPIKATENDSNPEHMTKVDDKEVA